MAGQARCQRAADPPLAQPQAGQRRDLRLVRVALAAAPDRGFQREHPDIDIRVSAHDAIADLDDPELDLALRYLNPAQVPEGAVHMFDETLTPVVSRALWEQIRLGNAPPLAQPADLDDPELDLALRYCSPAQAPVGAIRLFGEVLTPVVSRSLAEQIRLGHAPALSVPADLAEHTLAEEDDTKTSTEFLSWRRWLTLHDQPNLEPKRWLYLNFTYQQVQAALAGHGVALARVPLVYEALQRGELVEPFGPAGRVGSPFSYWRVVSPASRSRSEVMEFCAWVEAQSTATRAAVGQVRDAP